MTHHVISNSVPRKSAEQQSIFACLQEFICCIQNKNPVTQANFQLGQLKIYLRNFEECVSSIPQSKGYSHE